MKFRIAGWLTLALLASAPAFGNDISNSTWSEIGASNTASPPNGWPTGVTPTQVSPMMRETMGAIKRWYNRANATKTSGGSANAQTLTYVQPTAAYVSGDGYTFIAGFTNTGPATLNVDGLGVKAIKNNAAVLGGGEIVAGRVVNVYYDGTDFQMSAALYGSSVIRDNKSTALVAEGSGLSVFSQTSAAANALYLWRCAISSTCTNPTHSGNYDALRAVAVSPATQTVDLVNAVSGYILNQTPRTGPSYPSFPVATAINGIGICDADGCGTWGINTIVSDNQGQAISSHGPRFIFGGEFDVQATSPATRVSGVSTGGSSLVQPFSADAFNCLYLDGAVAAGSVAKWSGCYESRDGAAVSFAIIGAKESAGTSINSQDVSFRFFDASSTQQTMSMAATPGGLLIATTGAGISGSIAIPASAVFATGNLGGLVINNRTAVTGIAGSITFAPDVAWTTALFGNATSATHFLGSSITMFANTSVNGTFQVTQASPAVAAACVAGQIVADTGFLYTCSASGAWKRVAVAAY